MKSPLQQKLDEAAAAEAKRKTRAALVALPIAFAVTLYLTMSGWTYTLGARFVVLIAIGICAAVYTVMMVIQEPEP